MNLPNLLTILRFCLIPVYAIVFYKGDLPLAFAILMLAGATDVLDGYIARTRGLVTQLGAMLDPLADKLMLITVILSLLFSGLIPWPAAIAFFLRDIGMIVGSVYFHFRGLKTVPANALGKVTTVLFYVAILMIIFDLPYAIPYLWGVLAFAFLTSVFYIISFRKLNDIGQNPDRKRAHF